MSHSSDQGGERKLLAGGTTRNLSIFNKRRENNWKLEGSHLRVNTLPVIFYGTGMLVLRVELCSPIFLQSSKKLPEKSNHNPVR
jgi:hypothetical protein